MGEGRLNMNNNNNNKLTTTLLTPRQYYKPFSYPWAYEYFIAQTKKHWIKDEVSLGEDVHDWNFRTSEKEKNLLTQILRFFTAGDCVIAEKYTQNYIPIFGKVPEVNMMLTTFAAMEAIHMDAYSSLLDTLGMPEVEYKAFMEYDEMRGKYDYLNSVGDFHHLANKEELSLADKRLIAKSLAIFSAFTEGMMLFSSFAILLNFGRQGKFKGMSKIVLFSIADECYSDDTEILTENGWKLFKDLQDNERVAQFNQDNKEVSFVAPSHYSKNNNHKELVHFYNKKGGIDLLVTPNHSIPYYSEHYKTKDLKADSKQAKEFEPRYRRKLPISGFTTTEGPSLTVEERILIALQADGNIPKGKFRNGNLCGYRRCILGLKKSRKIERFSSLLDSSTYSYNIPEKANSRGMVRITVDIPKEVATKSFKDWVHLPNVSSKWASEFIEELLHWDGHDVLGEGKVIEYSSTDKDNTDIIQALGTLCGYKISYRLQVDNRKESHKDVHKLWIKRNTTQVPTEQVKKEIVPYNGYVYCVTVPDGNLITRRNNRVVISGNSIHVNGMIELFRTFIQENPEIWTDYFKGELYRVARDMVDLEDKFIDLAFGMGDVEGLSKKDVKTYIRFTADKRLKQLGLKPNTESEKWKSYGSKANPLTWLNELLNSSEHVNFFEGRSTAYTKGSITGDWATDVWKF